mgnify:CR=1 FL=1
MAANEQKRQKKLAKQQSKEKKAKRELARQKQEMSSLAGRMRLASRYPIMECKVSTRKGMMPYMLTVVLSRRMPGGEIAMANFLLDCGCLGVKDAHGQYCTPGQYREMLEKLDRRRTMEDVEPERARALIEQTAQFAASLGFSPCADFMKAFALFGDVDASQCTEVFPMGNEEGKPMYISGPFNDAAKQHAILAQLASVSGGEEPSFIIGMRSSELRELEDIGWEENDLRELDGEVVIDAPFHRVKSSVNQS